MKRSAVVVGVVAALLLGLAAWWIAGRDPEPSVDASLAVASALAGGSTEGYARAVQPRDFTFPADHGAHPDFRTEWWYVTGYVDADADRRFGFQLTFFRNAMAPPDPRAPERASAWATRQVYLAHFALTDLRGERFFAFERMARAAANLAGAPEAGRVEPGEPYHVWLEDWRLEGTEPGDLLPLRLVATAQSEDGAEVGLNVTLDSTKPPVLQGDGGLSQKGPEPGNASYYYSLTRLQGEGAVRMDGERFPGTVTAWMDREWSTSALGKGEVGWDWFSLQLDDGRELMLYRIRRVDGTATPASQGTLVEPEGSSRKVAMADVEIDVLNHWMSPETRIRYPSSWRLSVPSEELDLTVTPWIENQELNLTFRYWEGAVSVEGTGPAGPVSGRGYVELTGYGEGLRSKSPPHRQQRQEGQRDDSQALQTNPADPLSL